MLTNLTSGRTYFGTFTTPAVGVLADGHRDVLVLEREASLKKTFPL